MSLKDDFLEALRSVKRDFLRDSEYEEPSAPVAGAARREVAPGSGDFSYDPSRGDEDIFENFGSADPAGGAPQGDDSDLFADVPTFSDDYTVEDPADGAYAQDTYADYGPSGGTPEFVSINGAGSGNGNGGNGGEPPYIDFESGSVYGDDKTVISKNTIIRGALQTEDNVRLLGQVMGDIECKSNIVVAGKVRGNTTAANAFIFDAQVDGDLRCDDVVSVSNDAWVLGNIRAQQAEIDGKIKGNIEIRHMVSIGATSSVLGDISADELEIKRGAFVNGQIMMYSPSRDVLDRFDRFQE